MNSSTFRFAEHEWTVQSALDACENYVTHHPLTVRHYDGDVNVSTHSVTTQDIGRLLTIEPLYQHQVEALLSLPDDLVSSVEVNARLVDILTDVRLYESAHDVFDQVVTLPQVGSAIASKILHLKRPGFFPILDSKIRDLYLNAGKVSKSNTGRSRVPLKDSFWYAIAHELDDGSNIDALRRLRAALAEKGSLLFHASDVRLHDIICWSAVA